MTGTLAQVEARRRVAIGAAVAGLHVGVLVWLGLSVVPVLPEVTAKAVDIFLVRPVTRPGPDSDHPVSGGGAPSSASIVHRAPEPRLEAVELTAPVEPALIQPLVMSVEPVIRPSDSTGVGTGRGDGVGAGEGPGSGGGSAAVLIAAPADSIVTRDVQSVALVREDRAHVVLRCRIRLSQRLDGCRVIAEHPRPSGYRREALGRAREFRFRPEARSGRAIDRQPVVVAIAFPAPEAAPADTAG